MGERSQDELASIVPEAPAGRCDLAGLRIELEHEFALFDQSISAGTDAARAVRKRIKAAARDRLKEVAGISDPGFYLFADSAASDMRGIRYIGCAHGQSILSRVSDYLLDDISSQDQAMLVRTPEERRLVAERRLRGTNTMTSEANLAKYVDGHMRSAAYAASGSLFVASCNAPSALIIAAEGILIASAWCAGVELGNKGCTLPKRSLRAEAYDVAENAIAGWLKAGLPAGPAGQWAQEVHSMRERWNSSPSLWEPF